MDACPSPLAPDTLNCSGRAVACISEQCICEPGWIGQGDFVSGSPACHLNVAGVRAVWGVVACLEAVCFGVTVLFFFNKSENKGVWWKERTVQIALVVLGASASLCALGLVRVIDPTRTIGTDPAATVLFSLGSMGFWTFAPMYLRVMIRLLENSLKGRNQEERSRIIAFVSVFRRLTPVFWFVAMVASVAPMFILISPSNPSLMYGLAACHFVILALNLLMGWFWSHCTIPPSLHDIDSALTDFPDTRLSAIHWKLSKFLGGVRDQAIFQALSAGIFGLWPYAQRYSSYEVALAWMGSAVVMGLGVYSMMPTKSKQTASGEVTAASTPRPVGTGGSLNTFEASHTNGRV